MASTLTIPTLDEITAQVLAYFRVEFPSRDLGPESWLGKQARAIALALLQIQQNQNDAAIDAVPSSDTSSLRLTEFAELFGRKGAQPSSGGAGTITYSGAGPFPYTLAAGTILTASDGVTEIETSAIVTWGSAGTQSGTFNAITEGTAGNLGIGAVLTFSSPPAGITSTVTLSTALSGGLDEESDADLLARLFARLQNPPKGGTAADYKAWAESQESVTVAYVYPRRQGTGSVDVAITQAGTGKARGYNGSTTVRDAVDAYIETVRPVTVEGANTLIPTMGASEACVIRCRVTAAPGFSWDWDDTAASYPTVKAGGTTTLLRINGSPPAALAVNDRIQIANTNASAPVLPEQVTVTTIDTVTINPDTILTVSPALTAYPVASDTIYAGGDVVDDVAQAVEFPANGHLRCKGVARGNHRPVGLEARRDCLSDGLGTSLIEHLDHAALLGDEGVDAGGFGVEVVGDRPLLCGRRK